MNETSVTVVGNVASDVTARQVGAEGQVVVSFRVMSSERRWDRASDSWVDGDRFSARVSCWRRLGDHVLMSLHKGDPVVVRGRVSVREYEVDGERRYSTEITASAVGPDLGRCTAQLTRLRTGADAPRTVSGEREVRGGTEALAPGVPGQAPVPAVPGPPVGVGAAGSLDDATPDTAPDDTSEPRPGPGDQLPAVA